VGEVDDCLRAGGDGCLVKPFALAELLARAEALGPPQRRSEGNGLRVDDLKLDLISRTATGGGRNIDLLPQEFQFLEYRSTTKVTS
jgi:two-component system, OmpR family, response regulator